MTLLNEFKRLFGRLSLLQIASAELAEAERSKMAAHSVQEHATAIISYEAARIKRLKAQINELSKAKEQK
jgi:hypothetical protein